MEKKHKPKKFEIKYERMDQYDYWDDELIIKKEKKYASYIGAFLIWFSYLEHSLDVELANIISERSHDDGYIIIKDLGMFGKIELFYNLSFPRVHFIEKRKNQKLNQLVSMKKQLEGLAVLRNKIAHAKWDTLDKDGYVRVDTKTNKESGLIEFRKLRITPTIMRQGIKEIEVLAEKLSIFVENIWQ